LFNVIAGFGKVCVTKNFSFYGAAMEDFPILVIGNSRKGLVVVNFGLSAVLLLEITGKLSMIVLSDCHV